MSNKQKQEGYNSRFGVSNIREGRFHEISIAWDSDTDLDDKSTRFPVINYTEDTENRSNHAHIPLTYEQAVKLQKWLTEYVDDVYMYHEGKKNES